MPTKAPVADLTLIGRELRACLGKELWPTANMNLPGCIRTLREACKDCLIQTPQRTC